MNLVCSIPVAVLLAAAFLIWLMNRGRPNIGTAWFAAILAGLIVWGWTVSFHFRRDIKIERFSNSGGVLAEQIAGEDGTEIPGTGTEEAGPLETGPAEAGLLGTEPAEEGSTEMEPAETEPSEVDTSEEDRSETDAAEGKVPEIAASVIADRFFILDGISYPYMLAVSSLLVILLLSGPSYLEPQIAPRLWVFYLLLEAIGYLAVSADDVTFIIYGWVIFDGIDLLAQYIQTRPGRIRHSFLTAVGVRFVGTILAASSLAYSNAVSPPGSALFISPEAGAFLLIACSLRMGILPVSQPYSEMSNARIGLGTMLRLISVVTVMPVLSRIPLAELAPGLMLFLKLAGSFASLTGAVGWLLSENSSSGNTYAALAISGMAFVCALNGAQISLIVWGVSIVLTCGPLSLYQIHNPLMSILGVLVVLCFSGLPYTPNAIGWNELIRPPYTLVDLLFILVPMCLTGGALIHIFRMKGRKFSDLEPWMRSVYPIGFAAAIGTHVFIGMFCFEEQFDTGVIPASITAFLGGVLIFLITRFSGSQRTQNAAAWGREGISLFWRVMRKLLDMEWLIAFGSLTARGVRSFAFAVSAVLEDSGGLVWELLLMALLIAAAFFGGRP